MANILSYFFIITLRIIEQLLPEKLKLLKVIY